MCPCFLKYLEHFASRSNHVLQEQIFEDVNNLVQVHVGCRRAVDAYQDFKRRYETVGGKCKLIIVSRRSQGLWRMVNTDIDSVLCRLPGSTIPDCNP